MQTATRAAAAAALAVAAIAAPFLAGLSAGGGTALGRRVVQNALLAYAVFQGWGNIPEKFDRGTAGDKLLEAAKKWSKSAGTDDLAGQNVAKYLGMPRIDSETNLPKFKLDEDVLILELKAVDEIHRGVRHGHRVPAQRIGRRGRGTRARGDRPIYCAVGRSRGEV